MNGFRRIYIDILFFFSPSPEKLISLDGLENYAKFRAVPMNMTNRWRFLCTFRGIFHLIRACGMISFPLIHVDVNVVNINDNVHIATIQCTLHPTNTNLINHQDLHVTLISFCCDTTPFAPVDFFYGHELFVIINSFLFYITTTKAASTILHLFRWTIYL